MLDIHAVLVPLLRAWLSKLAEMLSTGTDNALAAESWAALAGGQGYTWRFQLLYFCCNSDLNEAVVLNAAL